LGYARTTTRAEGGGRGRARRLAAVGAALLTVAACTSDTDKIGERLARQQLASQYLVVPLMTETCEFARKLALRDASSGAVAEERCKAATEARAELVRLEKVYLEACRACASPERCQNALGRLRERNGSLGSEGACP